MYQAIWSACHLWTSHNWDFLRLIQWDLQICEDKKLPQSVERSIDTLGLPSNHVQCVLLHEDLINADLTETKQVFGRKKQSTSIHK